MTNDKLEATFRGADLIDGDAIDFHADDAVLDSRYAWTAVVAAKLWHDEGQREAFVAHMTLQETPGYVRVDDEHRFAASFGQLVHGSGCEKLGEIQACSDDDCAIVPCEEADATVVLIRVEVKARKVDDADE